jgi:hypothetical protein
MAGGITIIKWKNYREGITGKGYFREDVVTYNSNQRGLHKLKEGERLWLVSQPPKDPRHYIVGTIRVARLMLNPEESLARRKFGKYAVVASCDGNRDFNKQFPAWGMVKGLKFQTGKPIQSEDKIGQSQQTIRLLSVEDERLLETATGI